MTDLVINTQAQVLMQGTNTNTHPVACSNDAQRFVGLLGGVETPASETVEQPTVKTPGQSEVTPTSVSNLTPEQKVLLENVKTSPAYTTFINARNDCTTKVQAYNDFVAGSQVEHEV